MADDEPDDETEEAADERPDPKPVRRDPGKAVKGGREKGPAR